MIIELRISGGKKLRSPKGFHTRPTTSRVRESLMNILRSKLIGCSLLDLFSGSGVIGCEALKNGASKVLAVEKDNKIAIICKENLLSTKSYLPEKKYIGVIKNDVISFLEKGCERLQVKGFEKERGFNFVYIDPPYSKKGIYDIVLKKLLKGNWVQKDSIVICEHSSEFNINPQSSWVEIDKRLYGKSSLLFLSPLS